MLVAGCSLAGADLDRRSDPVGREWLERYAGRGPWERFGSDSIQTYASSAWRSEAEQAEKAAREALPEIAAALGLRAADILPVWILVSPGGGGMTREAPLWSAAIAQPQSHLIVLDGPVLRRTTMDVHETVAHEIAHIALHVRIGPEAWVPRWFDEGVAMRLSGYERWRDRWATLGRGRVHLREIAMLFPRDAASAQLAYLESEAAVRKMQEEGPLGPLLDRIAAGADFDDAYAETYGEAWTAFADSLYGEVASPWRLIATLGGGVALGGVMTGLAVVAIVRVRRRDRRRMRQWQEDETEARGDAGTTTADRNESDAPRASEDDRRSEEHRTV